MKVRLQKNFNYILASALLCAVVGVASIAQESDAASLMLTKNLSLGMTDQQVLVLQQSLNARPDTQLALTGPGSPGNETFYFGPVTEKAVVKFQEKYRQQVLIPAGLTQGSGYVGPLTLAQINALNQNITQSQPISPSTVTVSTTASSFQASNPTTPLPTTSAGSATVKAQIRVFSAAPYEVKPGGIITIYGLYLPKNGLTISLGGQNLTIMSMTSSQITALLPSTLSPGTYTLSASYPNQTIAIGHPIQIVVTTNPKSQPKITNVSPKNATVNDTITIKGSGFTEDNTIYTPMGTISHVSSPDGTTLTFMPSALSKISQLAILKQKPQVAATAGIYMSVGVQNTGGFTSDNVYFILK